ncbi:rod shape-determining protein MreC [uncultured Ruminococcus sp.]|nr:rod shape-determining protein MreC [uncultured Clostridium sp.]SCI14721.1 rod shape-determining protein MreC [uncultured Ruminococcus sp.]
MKQFFRSGGFKVIVIMLVILGGVCVYSAAATPVTPAEQAIAALAVPLQRQSTALTQTVTGFWNRLFHYGELEENFREVEQERDELKRKLVEYEELKRSNLQLKGILGIKEEHPDYTFEEASIISRDPEWGDNRFTINKGTRQDVQERDMILVAGGLVGRVEKAGANYAVVTALTDPNFQVGAYDNSTNYLGVVSGNGDSCEIRYLTQEPEEGALIVTSGAGGNCPRGLLIGSVKKSEKQKSGTTYAASLEPVIDLSRLTDVMVLTGFDGQKEEP